MPRLILNDHLVRLSIIIPTYRRAAILAECLRRLEKQTIANELEIIVVSDGHDDETKQLFHTTHYPLLTTHYFEIPKSQQGVARNKGVEEATGEFVLFIGDDIFLEPDACEKHLLAHGPHPRPLPPPAPQEPGGGGTSEASGEGAVLGFTTWDPSCGITPIMKWLENSGWQFGYPFIAKYEHDVLPASIQHLYSYTSHISLPREIALKFPFLEDMTMYGWEDIEWGTRLRDVGIQLFYEPDAKALHHHHLELEDSLKRMETLGQSAKVFEKTVPGFDRVPKGWKLFLYKIAALLPTMAGRHRRAFLEGLRS